MGGRFYPFSLIVSNIGLSAIITYSVPVLMLIYPPAITLILLALLGNAFQHNKKVYVCVTICSWAASIFDFLAALPTKCSLPYIWNPSSHLPDIRFRCLI